MHPHRNYPRQPVGWGALHETPPPVIAPYVEPRPADWLLLAVLRPAWAYRLELLLIVLLAVAYVWVGLVLGFYFPYPPSFFITFLAFLAFVGVRVSHRQLA